MRYTLIAATLLIGACGHMTPTQLQQLQNINDEIRQDNQIRQLQNQQMMTNAALSAPRH